MKTILFPTLFIFAFWINAEAQYEESYWQSADLVKLGIVRMVTQKTTIAYAANESDREFQWENQTTVSRNGAQ
ncbi:MAG: hypothetical protein ACKVT2_21650 [Saprospiraceae bacterium]